MVVSGHSSTVSFTASLQTRVGVLALVFTGLCFGGAGLIADRQLSRALLDAEVVHAESVLKTLAGPIVLSLRNGDLRQVETFLMTVDQHASSHAVELSVFDRDTTVVATTKRSGAEADEDARALLKVLEQDARSHGSFRYALGPAPRTPKFLAAALPLGEGGLSGSVLGQFSLEHFLARRNELRSIMVPLTIFTAAMSWLLAVAVLNILMLRPIRRLSDVAHQIGTGDFLVRAELERTDEIGELSRSLTAMARKLKGQTEGLQSAVAERTRDLEELNQELRRLANTDSLTGLRNRRYFEDSLTFELRRGERHPRDVVLCMIDIDHFKNFNDVLGHQAGDGVLREVARILARNLRATDIVARYGGEEFVAILLDTTFEEGLTTANKLCRIVRETPFSGEQHQPEGKLTISVGVAAFPSHGDTAEVLIRAADIALYEAKRQGRDQVVPFDPSIGPPENLAELPSASARPLSTSDLIPIRFRRGASSSRPATPPSASAAAWGSGRTGEP